MHRKKIFECSGNGILGNLITVQLRNVTSVLYVIMNVRHSRKNLFEMKKEIKRSF